MVARRIGELPLAPNTTARASAAVSLWLGPRSWLCLAEADDGSFDDARRLVNGAGGAVFDVSSSRLAWRIAGPQVAAVLGRLCPLDLHVRAFTVGSCAQSLLGHIE